MTTHFDAFYIGAPVLCTVLTSATITPDPANTGLLCDSHQYTASYLPLAATAPITYTWSTDGLIAGQGTATATYSWSETCEHDVTVTIANPCGSVSDTETVDIIFTLAQIADAIKNTLATSMSAAYLSRAYGYDELPEGINDAPSLMVYWQSVINDAFTDTDRTTMKGAVKCKEIVFYVDYVANPRNNLAENNALLTGAASEIIDILEMNAATCTYPAHCPPFGLCGLKNFKWQGERVTLDYGGALYYAARFIITVRVF